MPVGQQSEGIVVTFKTELDPRFLLSGAFDTEVVINAVGRTNRSGKDHGKILVLWRHAVQAASCFIISQTSCRAAGISKVMPDISDVTRSSGQVTSVP